MNLKFDQIAQIREQILNILGEHGAISRYSKVKSEIMLKTLGIEYDDFKTICHHLKDADLLKYTQTIGTTTTKSRIATIWLTPKGFERVKLQKMPRWMKKQASDESKLQASGIIKLIKDWTPKQRYQYEESFVSALSEYLEGKGIKAPEQEGGSLTDILAAYGIGIEVKVKPDRSEYDRLLGQIIRQLEEFGFAIVLLFRTDKRDLLREYEDKFINDPRVVFIVK